MKRIIILLVALLPLAAFAQTNAVERYFSDLVDDDRFTMVSISGKMFELMTHIEGETPEEVEMLKAISNLKGMKLIACGNCDDQESLYSKALKRFDASFEELLRIENDSENLTFLIRETNGMIAELVLVGYSAGEFTIMSLTGDIDLNQIVRIGRAVNIDGLQKLEKMEEK